MFFPVVAVVTVLSYVLAAPVNVPRALPTPVSVSTAKTYLAARGFQARALYIYRQLITLRVIVTVEEESNSPAYVRTEFKTWITSKNDQVTGARNIQLTR